MTDVADASWFRGFGSTGGAEDDGADILDEVRSFVGRFVAFPSEDALVAVTLWIAHTHAIEHFYTSPRLSLLSPEPQSGKTRVLEVLNALVSNPLFAFSASPAAIFRTIDKKQITLLYDEVDTVFQQRGSGDNNEDLRALLNAGYKTGAKIPRCVGSSHAVKEFRVFGAAALVGLKDLPDTIMSRSIIVRMHRRLDSEHVEPWRARMHEQEAEGLRDRLAAWAGQIGETAGAAWPEMPDGIEDRPAELWEPLLAIADQAGRHWPETARRAAVQMVKVASSREATLGMRLLQDLRLVWGADDKVLKSTAIVERLRGLEEAPWGELYGKGMTPRNLSDLLRRYGVSSQQIKALGGKGYRRSDLEDVWARYLKAEPLTPKPAKPTKPNSSNRVQEDLSVVSDGGSEPETDPKPEGPVRTRDARSSRARVPFGEKN